MEPCISEKQKRSYHAIMGPIAEDVSLLSKKRKKLFEDINNQIDCLIKLVKDTGEKLDNKHAQILIPEPMILSSSKDGPIKSSTEESHSESGQMSESSKLHLTEFVDTVKSLNIHKRISKSYREFNNECNNLGKLLFGNNSCDSYMMFDAAKLDEKLLCKMIGMHFLHYGLFDVYEKLKLESIELWGENNKSIISDMIIIAYRTLHDLLDNIESCNTEPVIDWINRQYDTSTLHIERFNEILINLYKIRFLKELFKDSDLNANASLDITSDVINEVKNSSISTLWRMHNDEIGKLISQVLLRQNMPTISEFDELKRRTSKLFRRVFCETGILIKKPDNYDDSLMYYETSDDDSEDVKTLDDTVEEDCELESSENDRSAFIYRQWLDKPRTGLYTHHLNKVPFKSWLSALSEPLGNRAVSVKPPIEHVSTLPKNWINLKSSFNELKKEPKMAYRYLNPKSLKHCAALNFVNQRLRNSVGPLPSLPISKSTLINTLTDPETVCRQNINIDKDLLSIIPHFMESQRADEDTTMSRYNDETWQTTARSDRSTAVLIASGHELDESFLAEATQAEDSAQRSPPTFSLTVFAGSSIFRDNRLSSQLLDSDIISQGLFNVSSGSRIRIRFPNRGDESGDTVSQTRRDQSVIPSDADEVTDVLDGAGSESNTALDEEGAIQSFERSNVTLRDILRMIMRGLRSESSQPTAVVRLRGSRAGQNIEELRSSLLGDSGSISSTDRASNSTSIKKSTRKKCLMQTAVPNDNNHVCVYLPYESPLSVLTCAGHVTYPYLLDVLKVLFKEQCEVSSKVGTWLKSNQQLPVESDLGPVFHFHSYLTCAVSKDQTNSENLPMMLPCGHVICRICHDRLSGKRRKRQFKCPMCPTIVEPNQTIELYLD